MNVAKKSAYGAAGDPFADLPDTLEGDPLAAVLNTPVDQRVPSKQPPADYKAPNYIEGCKKCGGSGFWRPGYPCFACKGKGSKTYKQAPEKRAQQQQQRVNAAERKAQNIAEQVAEFKTNHPQVWAWMDGNTFEFAASLNESLHKYGSLTEKQLAAAQNAAAKYLAAKEAAAARKAALVASAPVVDVSAIEIAFATARKRAERPGQRGVWTKPLRLKSGDGSIRVRPGSPGSQWEGMLFVKDEDDRKLGYVKAGRFVRRFECTDAEADAVVECMKAPKEALLAYAKAWSCCGVCGRTLTKDESIERGIGPICLGRFGFA